MSMDRPWSHLVPGALLALSTIACQAPLPPELPVGISFDLRGHEEIVPAPEGSWHPWLLGSGETIDLCLQTPAETPTSQWQARLWLTGGDADRHTGGQLLGPLAETSFAEPSGRLGTTLCFSLTMPERVARHDTALCAQVRDTYDDHTFLLPCRPLRVGGDDGPRRRLEGSLSDLLRQPPPGGIETLTTALDGLAAEARRAELPFMAVRIELVAVHFLRREGSGEALAEAERRLLAAPPWLDDRAAVGWRIKWEYERALLALDQDWDLRAAWRHLATADTLSARVLHPTRLTIRMKQAEILARVGALAEAIDRLGTALDDCATMPCRRGLVPSAHGVLGWLLALDPLARPEALDNARIHLGLALEGTRGDLLEAANQQLNLAYLALRQNENREDDETARDAVDSALTRAKITLARARREAAGREAARLELLEGWTLLLSGLSYLADGRPDAALDVCTAARRVGRPRLAAWASECEGRAQRRLGALDEARRAFESSMLLHRYATPEGLGQALVLGPGRRAETFYRAARLEVERGAPGAAWDRLAELDVLADRDGAPPCVPVADRAGREQLEERRGELLADLVRLEGPASGRERRRRESVRRALREQLEELLRTVADCATPEGQVGDPGTDEHEVGDQGLVLRIFAIDDEVLVLRRDGTGEITAMARNRWPRRERLELLDAIGHALDGRRLDGRRLDSHAIDDEDWRRLLAPAAEAVAADMIAAEAIDDEAPAASAPGWLGVALHGELQGLPLAALPLTAGGWLGERRIPVIWPGKGTSPERPAGNDHATPLLVVDPRGDLPAARALVEHYRVLFPQARILLGNAAERSALQTALPKTRWLHVDAHARYDPAFPELSSLLLADGPFTLAELGERAGALEFANLSGCRTGSWPITADSGRYGLAGRLARGGAPWVVATRSVLDDSLAGRYNRVFYRQLASFAAVPEAHARAMAEVRDHHPAVAWAALFLLRGRQESEHPGGQNLLSRTPYGYEGDVRQAAPPRAASSTMLAGDQR